MHDDVEMAERHARILAQLSEVCVGATLELNAWLSRAETPEAAAVVANALHNMARSVRQTLALESRLKRERIRAEREDRAAAARETQTRVTRRKAQVRAAVERLIWTEAEDDEAEQLLADLDDRVDEAALHADFLADPSKRTSLVSQESWASPLPPQPWGKRRRSPRNEQWTGRAEPTGPPASPPPRRRARTCSGGAPPEPRSSPQGSMHHRTTSPVPGKGQTR